MNSAFFSSTMSFYSELFFPLADKILTSYVYYE